jgi:hypothetical protein
MHGSPKPEGPKQLDGQREQHLLALQLANEQGAAHGQQRGDVFEGAVDVAGHVERKAHLNSQEALCSRPNRQKEQLPRLPGLFASFRPHQADRLRERPQHSPALRRRHLQTGVPTLRQLQIRSDYL